MSPLEQILKDRVPLSIAGFMVLALFHDEYGYYQSQEPIGKTGDFITAPEISQMFGELIGLWAVNVWDQLGKPSDFKWVELGPGRGTLLKDALRVTRRIPGFHDALRFSFVEINPYFQALQQEIVSQGTWHTTWQGCFEDPTQDKTPFVLIANEFLDVLPIHQYVCRQGELFERHVVYENEAWNFKDIKNPHSQAGHLQEGIFEICPEAQALVQSLSKILETQEGAGLFIDYGYMEGNGDSLQALYQGQQVSPLSHIGRADLTSHVDFGALKETAPKAIGPISQSAFLHNLGLSEWKEKLRANSSLEEKASLEAQYHRLTHPLQMGHLFKVMAITSNSIQPLGF